ncbi:MAG: SbcC/MukB-like Walker B domain-containing protein, partial [Myxococcota bacterium]
SARADESRGDVAAAELALDRARITWRARQSELGELILIDEPVGDAAKAWVDTRLSAASDQLGQLRGAEKEAAELADAALIARSAVVSRTSDLTQARTERSRCGDRARSCAGQLSECQAELERTAAALVRIIDLLGAAFTGAAWSDELAADPPAFTERYRDQVDQWQQHSAARDQAHKQLESATAKHSAVAAEAERQRQRERALADEHRQQAEALAKTAAQRAELFGGRDSSAVREQLIGAIETTDQAARTARQTGQDAGERAAAAAAHRDGLSTKRNEADIEAERAAVELAAAVAESGLDLDTLRQCAAVDETWLSQQRDQLQALERARDEARVRADERTEQRVKHETGHASGPEAGSEADSEAGGIPQLDLAAARAIIAQTEEEQKAAQRRQSELEVLVRRDDEARAARAEMATQVADKERRVKLYGTLSELIGSHDGKKFRVFAQSLTLDALLAYANHHLSDLASRYHLVRVPGYDLDLQVIDRDMGDEVRGINSLSGGESFLVSLALALGLSSLAARDTRVESLLIDEGFGSLDPSTLDAALAVLDALQATGRKVGLISHVPGLAERVGVRIMVRPQGGGRSIMRVTGR